MDDNGFSPTSPHSPTKVTGCTDTVAYRKVGSRIHSLAFRPDFPLAIVPVCVIAYRRIAVFFEPMRDYASILSVIQLFAE
jgi:hypothetical protein